MNTKVSQKSMPRSERGGATGGFTLIELLVVISIISLLASVVLASLNSARAKARAAQRLSELNQIQTALELYYNDNAAYPSTSNLFRSQCSNWGSYPASNVIPGLTPTYMPSFPADPAMGVGDPNYNCFIYKSDGVGYKFYDYRVYDMSLSDVQKSSFMDQTYTPGGTCFNNPQLNDQTLSFYTTTPDWQCTR